MKILTFFFILICAVSAAESAAATIIFTWFHEHVDWTTAKSRCEDRGQRLAVRDTHEKLVAFQDQVSLSPYLWVGFHDPAEDNFVWLNGNPLANDDDNWRGGEPDPGTQYCGYIAVYWEWADTHCTQTRSYICERNSKYNQWFECLTYSKL